jgi:DNA-binding LacI/PurR family transcriptional regulator
VRQDFGETGRRAVAVLLAEVSGEAVAERVQSLPELVVRGSTGTAPGAATTVNSSVTSRT